VYEFLPETPTDASETSANILVCIHGAYCDGQLFAYLASRISCKGFRVYALDLLGQGKSDGGRGDTQFDDSLESIDEVIQALKNNTENQELRVEEGNRASINHNVDVSHDNNTGKTKVFILGHSLGCTFVLWYVRRFKSSIDGIILMAPYLRIRTMKRRSDVEPSSLSFLYLFLRRQLTPKKVLTFVDVVPKLKKIGGEEISLLIRHRGDNFRYTIRFIVDIVGLRNDKVKEILKVELPVLILHGKRDRLVYSEVSQTLFNMIESQKKEIKLFDCDHWFYHCVFYQELAQLLSNQPSESDRNLVIQTIIDWTNQLVR
jgi:alpha-beta hydrolase superfamily lysophospholipase